MQLILLGNGNAFDHEIVTRDPLSDREFLALLLRTSFQFHVPSCMFLT
jgi:hypothetical protein